MSYLLSMAFLLAQAGTPGDSLPPGGPDGATPAAAAAPADENAATPEEGGGEADADAAADAPAGEQPAGEPGEDAAEEGAVGTPAGEKFWKRLDEVFSSGAIGLLRDGGWFMWPILLAGIIAAGVIIERYRSLKMLGGDTDEIRTQVRDLLQQDRVAEALELCEKHPGPVPAILSAGIRKYLVLQQLGYDAARIEEQVVKAMEDYSVHIVAALERHLPVLATVSSAAPMLGFLGTVSGMINSFDQIVSDFGKTNIVLAAAGGISEALLTTCFGLIVGIPAFMAFNYFTSVINRFVLDVEESATELIEVVTLHLALEDRDASPRNGESHTQPEAAAVGQK